MSRRVTGFAKAFLGACVLVVAACGDDTGTGDGAAGAGGLQGDGSAAVGGASGRDGSAGTSSTGSPDGGGTGGTSGNGGKDGGGTGGASGNGGRDGGGTGGEAGTGTGGTGTGGTGTGGTGGETKCKKNSDCSDGKFCNGAETCDPDAPGADANGCIDGKAPDCGDTARCTVDKCDEDANECTHTKDDARCETFDGNRFCNGADTCDPGDPTADGDGCVHEGFPCDDGFDCTADGCNDVADTCLHTPQNSRCADTNDGGNPDFCNVETCEPGALGHDGRGCLSVARNCADAVDCTDDSCNEGTDTCDHGPDDAFCDAANGGLCNGRDTCDPTLGCQQETLCAGIPCECDDGFACTDDGCSGGACTHDADHASCGNGAFCDGVEACLPNVAGADADGCVDGDLPDCGDAYDCTVDSCDPALNAGIGACRNVPDDNACRDTQFCNGQEVCAPGALGSDGAGCLDGPLCCADPPDCLTMVPCDCIDGVACTVDGCDSDANLGLGACDNIPDDNFCNIADGFKMCNGDETCVPQLSIADANGCIAGTPFACSDNFSCTKDSCNGLLDVCVYAPVDSRCNDLDFCDAAQLDGAERCDPSSVSPVPNPTTGCVSDPSTDCSTAACAAPYCDVPCTGATCDDAVSCTDEVCSEATDTCVQFFDHASCDPGEICSDADCTPGQMCMGDGDCNNTNRCFPEACMAGICVPAPRDCDDGIGCTRDFCTTDTMDPRADGNGCINDPNDTGGNNTACDDGNLCNGDELCDPVFDCGIVPTPLDCDDGVACTDDACDPDTGCVITPNDTNCTDAFCNDTFCSLTLGCQPLPPRDCDDSIACTTDSCDEANDECDHVTVDASCADAFFCNGVEVCNPNLGCQNGLPVQCNDGITCSDDSCDEAADACQFVYNSANCPSMEICTAVGCQTGASCTPPTTVCDDGLFCNGTEACSSSTNGVPGVCQPGSIPNCDDMNPCTVEACSDLLGQCTHTPRDQDLDGFGDSACGGTDCNDTDAAINPLAPDICDGIDNDCIGGVDNGLVSPGGMCTLSSQCCSNSCSNGTCTLPFPQCFAILDICTADFECCSGSCDTYIDGLQHCLVDGACALSGTACDTASDCCSLGCVGGVCSANPADTCTKETLACTTDVDCCSNNCAAGFCAAPAVTSCRVAGESCTSQGNCCSGLCYAMAGEDRCAPHDSCRGQGEICTEDTECCVGTKIAGADPADIRGCDDVTGQCVMLGSCLTTGEACSGVRACCSNLCVDAGWGVGICEFLPGCRPFHEVCTEDFQCCSDVLHDGDPEPDTGGCDVPDPSVDNVRRCINPPGCVDPGETCAAGGSGSSNNCCVLKSRGCLELGIGVSRCTNLDVCIDIGGECQFSEQCCNGLPCVPDQFGIYHCSSMCVGEGGTCGAHADCCPGSICYEAVCVPNNLGCTPVGQPCPPAPEACCSDFCFGGICSQP